jgi:hypothetical protein
LTLFGTDLASIGTSRVVFRIREFRSETACVARFVPLWHGIEKHGAGSGETKQFDRKIRGQKYEGSIAKREKPRMTRIARIPNGATGWFIEIAAHSPIRVICVIRGPVRSHFSFIHIPVFPFSFGRLTARHAALFVESPLLRSLGTVAAER